MGGVYVNINARINAIDICLWLAPTHCCRTELFAEIVRRP